MEVEKTLYVFTVKSGGNLEPYNYYGDRLDEISVFAESKEQAISIIKKEMSLDLINRLELRDVSLRKLYGNSSRAAETRGAIEESLTYQIRRL